MKQPLVSVIIPVFNASEFLKECLDSVLVQSYKNIEIICVDDGSNDNSVDIITGAEKHDSRVHLISQKNSGVSVARNTGIAHANGEFIAFLDADDTLDKDCIKKAVSEITKADSDILVFGTRTVCGTQTAKRWDFDIIQKISCNKLDGKKLPVMINLLHNIWDKLYRRDFLVRNNIQFPIGYKIGEDGAFNIECYLNNAKYAFLPECLYNYRIHQSSTVHTKESNILHNVEAFNWIERLDIYKQQSMDVKCAILGKYISGCIWLKKQLHQKVSMNTCRQLARFINEQKRKFGEKRIESLQEYGLYKKEFDRFTFKKFIKGLFSIDNDEEDKYKILTVMFVKFRFKKQHKALWNDYFKNANENSVMIFESQPHHGECLPSYIKYFNDIGLHVDVFVLPEIIEQNPFYRLPNTADFSVKELRYNMRDDFFNSEKILKYKHILISTAICYYEPQSSVVDNFPVLKKHPSLFIVEHDIQDIDKNNEREYLTAGHLITLWDFNKKTTMVNPCCFGSVKYGKQHKTTTFICVGNIEQKRKNHAALFDCMEKVLKHTTAFKVVIIGRIIDDFKIPDHLKDYITVTGYLNFPEMFEYMEKSDFFIPLLDASNVEHNRYITSGVSGSVQLILGFAKMPIIHQKFADFYGFNSNTALVFNSGDFSDMMLSAINMSETQYKQMQNNLIKYAKAIQNESLKNIERIVK